jgi:hypothetical protein
VIGFGVDAAQAAVSTCVVSLPFGSNFPTFLKLAARNTRTVGHMKFYIHAFKPRARGTPGNRIGRPGGIAAGAAGDPCLAPKFPNILRRAMTRG